MGSCVGPPAAYLGNYLTKTNTSFSQAIWPKDLIEKASYLVLEPSKGTPPPAPRPGFQPPNRTFRVIFCLPRTSGHYSHLELLYKVALQVPCSDGNSSRFVRKNKSQYQSPDSREAWTISEGIFQNKRPIQNSNWNKDPGSNHCSPLFFHFPQSWKFMLKNQWGWARYKGMCSNLKHVSWVLIHCTKIFCSRMSPFGDVHGLHPRLKD